MNPSDPTRCQEITEVWIDFTRYIHTWPQDKYLRICRRTTPGFRKLVEYIREINPDDPNTWVEFSSSEFKRLVRQALDDEDNNPPRFDIRENEPIYTSLYGYHDSQFLCLHEPKAQLKESIVMIPENI